MCDNKKNMKLYVAFVGILLVCGILLSQSAFAASTPGTQGMEKYDTTRLAKAAIDECFFGVGSSSNIWPYSGTCGDCYNLGGNPKVNQAYVWGIAKNGNNIWFGTAPNVHCLVMLGYLQSNTPVLTDSYVCEMSQNVVPGTGDFRPPDIFLYNTMTKALTKKNLLITTAGPPHSSRFAATIGLRSAGTLGDVVFLGGPSAIGGINLFAFDNSTGNFLGSGNLPYSNIRKWLVANGSLYAGMGRKVVKWTGTKADPWHFEEVGTVDNEDAAELVIHEGRIIVNTWPGGIGAGGLWISPILPAGGLTAADSANWQKVWSFDDYDPDPVTAATYGGGALASFDGYLYWGTMHVPMLSTLAHTEVYGEPPEEELGQTLLGTYRAISIFRGRYFGTANQQVELLYGEQFLPAYIGDTDGTGPQRGEWQILPNLLKQEPRWGSAGFGNFFNNYTWAMAVYNQQLFIGTMDWLYLILGDTLDEGDLIQRMLDSLMQRDYYGADLWCIRSSRVPAYAVDTTGLGNYGSYGVRNMLSDDALYAGMANPMNLMTNPNDNKPEGGWELLKITVRQKGKP
jgi:hypothetical protein